MSVESIIGVTSGLIAIVGAVYGRICWLRRKFKECPTIELFVQLTKKETMDVNRRAILKKINKSSLIKNRIKEEYIQNFTLGTRGKEDVLFDICDCNNIHPTNDICKAMLGYSRPALMERYHEKRNNHIAQSSVEVFSGSEIKETCNQKGKQIVYMSELLKTKYAQACNELTQILDKHNVKYLFLKGTKDIWCRDYMPIQTESGKLIQFKYAPSYLKGKKEWEDSCSDAEFVCQQNNIKAQSSDIILDGGNVLICNNRAIISDRVFSENTGKSKEEIIDALGKLLECEIIIIPSQKSDMTGHADGMVRFVDRNTILGNKLADEFKYWREGIQKVIKKYNLKYIDVPFFEPKDRNHPLSAIGIYVNYLDVEDLIVLPVFGREEDNQVVSIMKEAFPEKIIETINYNEVAQEGGLLNCTTWVLNR